MNAAETLHLAATGMRAEGEWGVAMADWFDGIREPLGRRQHAGDDEVRAALLFAKAWLGAGS